MRITIYCSSSALTPPAYGDAAYRLGQQCASRGATVVFGGGGLGSMGRLADGVLAARGRIIGVMPRFMRDLEWAHRGVQEFVWTEGLADRKQKMMEGADALIALPGGCGTFEELLEAITLKRLGLFLNPIVIVNQDGFYDPLIALFDRCVAEHLMDPRHSAMWSVARSVDEVFEAIRLAEPWNEEARAFAALRPAASPA